MPEETSTPNVRYLHFSVNGGIITDLAREKLFASDDLVGAMDLLLSATMTDQLSEAERVVQALAILDGRKVIAGVYPGDTYGVYDVDEADRDPTRTLATYFERMKNRKAATDERLQTFLDKLDVCADVLTETQMIRCDREYQRQYETTDTIFSAYRPEDRTSLGLVDSFLRQQTQGPDDPYGWLFPDGTFHPVEWGEHQGWAYRWLMENDPEFKENQHHGDPETRVSIDRAGDYLNARHSAVLLHNPTMGVADVTNPAGHDLTKAQREYLFDYYSKMGLDAKASSFYQED